MLTEDASKITADTKQNALLILANLGHLKEEPQSKKNQTYAWFVCFNGGTFNVNMWSHVDRRTYRSKKRHNHEGTSLMKDFFLNHSFLCEKNFDSSVGFFSVSCIFSCIHGIMYFYSVFMCEPQLCALVTFVLVLEIMNPVCCICNKEFHIVTPVKPLWQSIVPKFYLDYVLFGSL